MSNLVIVPTEPTEEELLSMEFFSKKKKKKDKKPNLTTESIVDEDITLESGILETPPPYTYSELLDRCNAVYTQNNTKLNENNKYSIPPPTIAKMGSKRVVWTNFALFCEKVGRTLDHVFQYMVAELGAECSIDGTNQLVIKGKFASKYIESLMKKYMMEYVQCTSCRSLNTTITKDSVSRLLFIRCTDCMCIRSVSQIKKGFHAQMRSDRIASRNS